MHAGCQNNILGIAYSTKLKLAEHIVGNTELTKMSFVRATTITSTAITIAATTTTKAKVKISGDTEGMLN